MCVARGLGSQRALINAGKAALMNKDVLQGKWHEVKRKVKDQWGKLTDDDLNVIGGQRDQLEGKIQQRYGLAKDQVRKDVDDWFAAQRW